MNEQTFSESEEKKLQKAWGLILEQYFEYIKGMTLEHGSGINLFRFLRSPNKNGENCEYYFIHRNGEWWNSVMNETPNNETLISKYDNSESVLISVHIPIGINGDNTIGNIRLFSVEGEEIDLTEENSIDESSTGEPSEGGLRRRCVPSE